MFLSWLRCMRYAAGWNVYCVYTACEIIDYRERTLDINSWDSVGNNECDIVTLGLFERISTELQQSLVGQIWYSRAAVSRVTLI